MTTPRAVIFGCAGTALGDAERRFFAEADPLGFILFARNCENPDQVRRLVADLRGAVGRADAPLLIDQEGGRVARLKPPHWRAAPPAAVFAELAKGDPEAGAEAARLNARLIAEELAELGISVDCAPVLDLPQFDADPIIGDRAAGGDPRSSVLLGASACQGFLDGGVLPVIKHIPGHGRATVDSHLQLPEVTATAAEMDCHDFVPFRALRMMPWAMTAHVVYTAFDATAPASTSAAVVETVIRGEIGFDGVLISDDICMKALSGRPGDRAAAVLAAGCDLVLHCDGNLADMQAVAADTATLTDAAAERLRRGEAMRAARKPLDRAAALARLADLIKDLEDR